MFQVFTPASPGSSTQCFMWPSYNSSSSCAGFTIHPRHSHLHLHLHLHLRLLFPLPLFLVSFFTSCLPPSFIRIPFTTRCSSGILLCRSVLHRNVLRKLSPRHRHPSEIKQCLPPGSMSHFLAKQYMAILPPCDWRTSGTEWQRGGHKIPLKEQMLASSWHMPPRWSRVDGNWRGRQGM